MSFSSCPTDILITIFTICAIESPCNALLPLLLTCRDLHALAEPFLFRFVVLQTEHSIYGLSERLANFSRAFHHPIYHLCIMEPTARGAYSYKNAFLRIIRHASPTLRSLTSYNFIESQASFIQIQKPLPMLEEFVAIGRPPFIPNRSKGVIFPGLKRVYMQSSPQAEALLAKYPNLKFVRLEMLTQLYQSNPFVPSQETAKGWKELVIDVGLMLDSHWESTMHCVHRGDCGYNKNLADCESLAAAIKGRATLLFTEPDHPTISRMDLFLEAWKDRMYGGLGWWTAELRPTQAVEKSWKNATMLYNLAEALSILKNSMPPQAHVTPSKTDMRVQANMSGSIKPACTLHLGANTNFDQVHMLLNSLPVEILECICEENALEAPGKGLLPLLTTSRFFYMLARRYLYRFITINHGYQLVMLARTLQTAKYLQELEIWHLFLISEDHYGSRHSYYVADLERVLAFAAPTLRSLTGCGSAGIGNIVMRTPFPKLEEYVDMGHEVMGFSSTYSYQQAFPSLRRVYLKASCQTISFLASFPALEYVRVYAVEPPSLIPSNMAGRDWPHFMIDVEDESQHLVSESDALLLTPTHADRVTRLERMVDMWIERLRGGFGWCSASWEAAMTDEDEDEDDGYEDYEHSTGSGAIGNVSKTESETYSDWDWNPAW